MQPTKRPQNTATQVRLVQSTHGTDSNKSVCGSRFLGNDFGNRGSWGPLNGVGCRAEPFRAERFSIYAATRFETGLSFIEVFRPLRPRVTGTSPCACLFSFHVTHPKPRSASIFWIAR